MKGKTVEERYQENLKRQKKTIDEFITHETEWANDLIKWFAYKKLDMPEDEYRGCAYFINKEYLNKKGSITLLYQAYLSCNEELPEVTRENAFDLVRYKYRLYAHVLSKGGFG